jgi:wyosine [tRNA(Phe)-imidazoG37] synthetase (radical SAM superfamily)
MGVVSLFAAHLPDNIVFGPVPSRRLGRSLGINNIPPKICSYSCVYCQLGRTIGLSAERQAFYDPDEIFRHVRDKVAQTRRAKEPIDFITFVPDGEPTLDLNLGRTITLLRTLGIRIAVITNGSLLARPDARADLAGADWVSLKVDAVQGDVWHRINRPHGSLRLPTILEGMRDFSRAFRGELVTETMLVHDVNDGVGAVRDIADFLARLGLSRAYLAVPIRPPAEAWVRSPDEAVVNRAFQILHEKVAHVEYLIGYEGSSFASTGNVEADFLAIIAVHPMREDAVQEFLARGGADWSLVGRLLARRLLVMMSYEGRTFYMRRLPRPGRRVAA